MVESPEESEQKQKNRAGRFYDAGFMKRGEFLRFMGRGGLWVSLTAFLAWLLTCARRTPPRPAGRLPFEPITPESRDELVLAKGLRYQILIQEGESLTSDLSFGKNNDFLAFCPLEDTPAARAGNEALLWVNHEYPIPLFTESAVVKQAGTLAEAEAMRRSVGASILRIRRKGPGDPWKFIPDHKSNWRLDGETSIPIIAPRPPGGGSPAEGTLGNCSGGVTPWNTILSAEENHRDYYGEVDYKIGEPDQNNPKRKIRKNGYGWQKFFTRHPEEYGWIVEADPIRRKARKLTALGRFHHESATVVLTSDGRPVVYTGDDINGGCIYKFVSDHKYRPGVDTAPLLASGRLFVANLERQRWEELNIERAELKNRFADQMEVLTRTREAAGYVGGSKLSRPEDIEIDPKNGGVFIALTNYVGKNDYYGSLLRINEAGGDYAALTFRSDTYLEGGDENGFACPDNMVFDRRGNLWLTSDISGSYLNRHPYKSFGNNGLFYLPMSGPDAGKVFQVASAPTDAEFTGPCFSKDGRTLFLSVQHPGLESKNLQDLTSHWPGGGNDIPRSAVVMITGDLLSG